MMSTASATNTTSTRRVVTLGLLAAIATLLMVFLEFPVPGFPPYLKYDPSEIPGLLAAFGIGPWAGVLVELVKSLLFMISGKNATGIVGGAAAFLAGASLSLVAGYMYQWYKGKGRMLVALVVASLAMTAVMTFGNYAFFLRAWGIPANQVGVIATTVILPFNLVKGLITSVIALVFFARLRPERLPM